MATRYPIDLVQYLAVRVWYERELVQKACAEMLGIDGNAHGDFSPMPKASPRSAEGNGSARLLEERPGA